MKKLVRFLFLFLACLVVLYILGPKYPLAAFDCQPSNNSFDMGSVASMIANREANTAAVKADNEARIIWVDSLQKTEWSLVYLHGFSASQMEGYPTYDNLAKKYGMNTYVTRLPGHGVQDENSLLEVTAADYMAYAKEAIDIGATLGKKVLVMSTSTGSTLSAYLASCDDRIKSLVMLSPNFGIANPMFDFLDGPWGLAMAKSQVEDGYRSWDPPSENIRDYWQTRYRIEGLIVLDQLVSNCITDEVIANIDIPFYIGAYYKNEEEQDRVVDVSKNDYFISTVATAKENIKYEKFPEAKHHVLGSAIWSDHYKLVQQSIEDFMDEVLGMGKGE